MCLVVDNSCVGGADEKHLYGGDEALVVLHTEVNDRKVLFEKFPVEASGVFGDGVGVVVLNGKEKLRCVEFGFVVLVCLNLGSSN